MSLLNDNNLIDILTIYGTGRRSMNDEIFLNHKTPERLGIYDSDDEVTPDKKINTMCHVLNCNFVAESLLDFENHYNSNHRYSCSQCKKNLPSPHLLDLHLQEKHDSFFAVMSARRPSFCCYIQECPDKFMTPDERLDHCVIAHKLPRDYRFEESFKKQKFKKPKNKNKTEMEVDGECTKIDETDRSTENKIYLKNNKEKTFMAQNRFKKQTKGSTKVNIDAIMTDIKDSLPT